VRVSEGVAVVTGAGSGIGRAVTVGLLGAGYRVALAGRREQALRETLAAAPGASNRALVVPTDVTEVEQCEELVSRAVSEFGRLDVLVNNAGGSTTKPIAEWTPGEWHEIVDLNLGSVWFLSRFAVAPMIEAGKGAIVNISSGSSLFPFPMGAPYGASKAAVNNLTATMAAAWTPKGVRVNALAVGAVRTQMLIDDGKKYGLDEVALGAGNSMGRLGEPDEIGYAVLYFASDASSYCSGQTLWINGGPKAPGG
jgi:NAD(P)-dependent dehydrogenase (short-subunit alcohol dehydrogenase family)